ncbi:hypothetical protein Mgra_00004634 [Meloidogyne graminicola]|uniref:Uncharacterized protein n=1 Tax=Meloidogyne graminicola TaxID=189291 RepID=A0A8S9ZRQ1_9BILA|nr:hypothetical protein Mgra_00004634 [Meloidogyne graminicola]
MEEYQPIIERPSTFFRFSTSFFKFSIFSKRSNNSCNSSRSSPISKLISPRETPSTSSISPMVESIISLPSVINNLTTTTTITINNNNNKTLLKQEEIKLAAQTLKKSLQIVDFGNEIVIRLLNDKRSLYKSLLARCAPQAHEIEVFDVQSLARFCPRAVQVGNGVTRFFERIVIALEEENQSIIELEEKLAEMCRANGQMHYRMKVWFQAENWLCVKHSVVDTILMANSNLKKGKQGKIN